MRKQLLFSLAFAASVASLHAQVEIKPTLLSDNATYTDIAESFARQQHLNKEITAGKVDGSLIVADGEHSDNNAVNKAKAQANEIWWSYPDEGGRLNAIHLNNTQGYHVAMVVPKALAGAKVNALSVMFQNQSDLASDVQFFFAPIVKDAKGKPVPGNYDKTFTLKRADVKNATQDGLHPSVLTLPEAYQIPAEGCFVGYSFTASDGAQNPIVLLYGREVDGGCYLKLSNGWHSLYGNNYGNATIALHADVTGLVSSNVSVDKMPESSAKVGTTGMLTTQITNNGYSPVSSFSYILTVDKQVLPEQTYTFNKQSLPSTASAYVNLPCAVKTEGEKKVAMKITKVDGIANASDASEYAGGTLLALAETANRTSLVEETTGAWNGLCPRGHVGMKRLKEDLGDKVITLASHVGVNSNDENETHADAMTTANASTGVGDYFLYQYIIGGGQAPAAKFDRTVTADPYFGLGSNNTQTDINYGATDVVNAIRQSIPSEADLKLSATWTDASHTAINANVATTFKINRQAYPYGVVFVLSEDGMKDPNPSDEELHFPWVQENFYSAEYAQLYKQYFHEDYTGADPYTAEDMKVYRKGHYYVTNQVYDNVIVGAWGPSVKLNAWSYVPDVVNGFSDPYKQLTASKDVEQSWSKQLPLSSSTTQLVQDYAKLKLTAMLVNHHNGRVVNAAQVAIGSSTGIKGIARTAATEAKVIARYNANGQLIKTPQKGLNIIKLSNGKSIKVLVNK